MIQAPPLLPHSLDAERAVLGRIMRGDPATPDVLNLLRDRDFYLRSHQLIYAAGSQLFAGAQRCDCRSIAELLKLTNSLDEVGGLSYVNALANDALGVSDVSAAAEIVHECSSIRQLLSCVQAVGDACLRPEWRTATALMEMAEQEVSALRHQQEKRLPTFHTMSNVVDALVGRMKATQNNSGGQRGLSTGFRDFDSHAIKLHAGDLIIVSGRPGMCKTAFAMNIVEYVAVDQKLPVAVFSMETAAEQLVLRMLASLGKFDLYALKNTSMDELEWARLACIFDEVRAAPLIIDDTDGLTPSELRDRARRIAQTNGLSLIVVDSIQLMRVPGIDHRADGIAVISRSLKALAQELGVPVIALSELNDEVDYRDDKRPRMADLRDAGSDQDADAVIFVYRDEYYFPETTEHRGRADLIIGRQRGGPTGTIVVGFDGRFLKFETLRSPEYSNYVG